MITTMIDDPRPIAAIETPGDTGYCWAVGRVGVTKIEIYLESTQLWFAIYKGDQITSRVNCAAVECVRYGSERAAG